jgi:hypothetical protein
MGTSRPHNKRASWSCGRCSRRLKGQASLLFGTQLSFSLTTLKCHNLSLELTTKARGCKVASQEKDLRVTSHVPGSAKSVREWTLTLPNELHVGSWSPKWILGSSEHNCRGQNPSPQKVLYIIEKLLKHRCLKWACIAHLDSWNTSYGQNKGRESNWQFDSRPLKVRNWLDFFACKQCATYR